MKWIENIREQQDDQSDKVGEESIGSLSSNCWCT